MNYTLTTLLVLLVLTGCTPFTPTAPNTPCARALTELDQISHDVAGTLVGNRITGRPWLRHNRLITHTIAEHPSDTALTTVLNSMSALATEGLSAEWAMVDEQRQQQWRRAHGIQSSFQAWLTGCVDAHIHQQLMQPSMTWKSLRAIPADNDYSTAARIAGAYPLAAIPFRWGVVNEQKQLTRDWGKIHDQQWTAYHAAPSHHNELLAQHAPRWLVSSRNEANRPGAPYWQGNRLAVNTQAPVSYAFVSQAHWRQQRLTQLNYVLWFSERPKLKRLDLVAGQHDAVVFRVNLTQDGKVVAYDSIHLCGCWYRLFLPPDAPFKPNNRFWQEPVLMQRVTPAKPMAVYLTADTHHIQYVTPAAHLDQTRHPTIPYRLAPFSELLALPHDKGVKAVFDRQGYVAGSQRPERWLFWPMGVKNPGALRRVGDHAISFIGRRYFDDPHLLEKVSGLQNITY